MKHDPSRIPTCCWSVSEDLTKISVSRTHDPSIHHPVLIHAWYILTAKTNIPATFNQSKSNFHCSTLGTTPCATSIFWLLQATAQGHRTSSDRIPPQTAPACVRGDHSRSESRGASCVRVRERRAEAEACGEYDPSKARGERGFRGCTIYFRVRTCTCGRYAVLYTEGR